MFEFLACMHVYASVCVPGVGGRREYQFILSGYRGFWATG